MLDNQSPLGLWPAAPSTPHHHHSTIDLMISAHTRSSEPTSYSPRHIPQHQGALGHRRLSLCVCEGSTGAMAVKSQREDILIGVIVIKS